MESDQRTQIDHVGAVAEEEVVVVVKEEEEGVVAEAGLVRQTTMKTQNTNQDHGDHQEERVIAVV